MAPCSRRPPRRSNGRHRRRAPRRSERPAGRISRDMATAATIAQATLGDALPELRPGLVPRARLVRSLVACRNTPVAAIVAPPGYGKSTVLAEWAARDDRPFRWLAVQGDDDALQVIERTRAQQVLVVD